MFCVVLTVCFVPVYFFLLDFRIKKSLSRYNLLFSFFVHTSKSTLTKMHKSHNVIYMTASVIPTNLTRWVQHDLLVGVKPACLTVYLGKSILCRVLPTPFTWVSPPNSTPMNLVGWCKSTTNMSWNLFGGICLLPSFAHSSYQSNPPKSTPMNLVGWCKSKTDMSYRLFREICLSPSFGKFRPLHSLA